MKIGLIERHANYRRGWEFIPHILLGPVMWRCTNGRPNYRTEWRLHFRWDRNCISRRWTIGVEFDEWRKSVHTPTEDSLGRCYKTTSLTLCFLLWEFDITIARSQNTKIGTGDIAP